MRMSLEKQAELRKEIEKGKDLKKEESNNEWMIRNISEVSKEAKKYWTYTELLGFLLPLRWCKQCYAVSPWS